jgi:hypothetical protein
VPVVAAPTRRLLSTLLAALLLAGAGVGLTALVAGAQEGARSGTVTLAVEAVLDAAELADLPGRDGIQPTAAEVARLQAVLDRTSVVLQVAADGSRRVALRWDDAVAVDVRVDGAGLRDLPMPDHLSPDHLSPDHLAHADPAALHAALADLGPVDLTVAGRIDVAVLLDMAVASGLAEDVGPADLLDLPTRAGEALPGPLAPALGDLLVGRWVAVSGPVDLAEHLTAHAGPAPERGADDGIDRLHDLGALVEELTRTTVDPSGAPAGARLDLLDLLVRLVQGSADSSAHSPAEARALADLVAGWTATSVQAVAVVTDRGAVPTVWSDVEPATTLGWDDLRHDR